MTDGRPEDPMPKDAQPIDLLIIGGGLAGGLIALAMRARRPDLRTVVIEAGERAGGNHIWSCFASDVPLSARWLIDPLIAYGWSGYDVRFPGTTRSLPAAYASLTSDRLDAALHNAMPAGDLILDTEVRTLTPTSAILADGRTIQTNAVIDARGAGDMSALDLGWQKFVGMAWHCAEPHGLSRPIIMAAKVDQAEGYRFVYTLPLSATDLFIEDTYYTAGPELDVEQLKRRIAIYAGRQGWSGTDGDRIETGVLPVCMSGDFETYWTAQAPGVAKVGLRGGFFHAMTGYTLPDAVRVALAVSSLPAFAGADLHDRLHAMALEHWRGQRFYRMLATMLFRAAEPEERWRVLARFYRLDPTLIGRFYAGQSSLYDKLRILTGKPPVPISRAIHALGAATS